MLAELARRAPETFARHRDARSFLLAADDATSAVLREHLPELAAARVEPDRDDRRRILVHHDSSKGPCCRVEGLLMGVGVHYGEGMLVEQTRCTARGDEGCTILCRFA